MNQRRQAALPQSCAPGWNPGEPARSTPVLPTPTRPVDVPWNDCDPKLGLPIRYYPVNNRVALCEVDPNPPFPPPPVLYRPISQTIFGAPFNGWIIVVQHIVPNGFNAKAVKVYTSLSSIEWSDAVEWGVFVATSQPKDQPGVPPPTIPSQIEGEIWRGKIEWVDWRPLMRSATPGTLVLIAARIRPEFFTVNVNPGGIPLLTPIRSQLMAEAEMHLLCQGIAEPC